MKKFALIIVKRAIIGVIFAVMPAVWVIAGSTNKQIATDEKGVAIKGYDAVAYFTEGRATKGNPEFAYSWRDTQWYFANTRHREMFAADPEQYAPQFGGHCANGLSVGKVVVADPEQWTIVDGKLYMKFNRSARDRWRQDKDAKIIKAENNWEQIHKSD